MDILEQINPSLAVCFSGHRPDRLPGRGEPDAQETILLNDALRKYIGDAVKRGKDTFINGLMAGWDIMAAEQVIVMKEQYPHIKLVTVAPYSVHFFTREKCWTEDWVKRAKEVCRLSDIRVSLSEHYRPGIYYERNRVVVDYSSELICYSDGGKGGTQHTMQYAKEKEHTVYNLFSFFMV